MARLILFLILAVFVARAFWRAVDGVIEGMTGRPPGARSPRGVSMSRDPVCGTFVDPQRAPSIVEGRTQVFFCSDACRDKYRKKTA